MLKIIHYLKMINMKFYSTNDPMFYELEQFIVRSNEFQKSNLPVCIHHIACGEDCIVFNTEQTSSKNFNYGRFQDNFIKEIWDYSEINCENFIKNGFTNVKYLKPILWEEYKQEILLLNPEKKFIYDVVFVGWINERRRLLLEEIKKRNINLVTITKNFGRERDLIISNSKVLLNLHFDEDHNIFEIIRCFPWLDTNKIVVSENSLDNDERCINVETSKIVETLEKILNND